MSWDYVHFDCCVATSSGDATAANQVLILAAIAAVKACVDNVEADTQDIQVGVDALEAALIKPVIC